MTIVTGSGRVDQVDILKPVVDMENSYIVLPTTDTAIGHAL